MEEKDIFIDDEMEEDEEDHKAKEKDFSSAVVWGTDWTTETIARQIIRGNIDLNPVFQRRDAWSAKEKSKLIESLMLNMPVPQIVLAEDPKNRNHFIVIDGKQRLLSIMQFYSDSEFLKQENDNIGYDILSLTGLEILKNLNKKTYSNIPEPYRSNIENATIRTIIIKNCPGEDFLYTVFLRLNTGSKKLSPQELRQALKPGEFLLYLEKASADSKQVRKMLNNKEPDKRMRDVELALRYFAFKYYISDYKGNLKAFMDDTCEKLNDEWEDNSESIIQDFKNLEDAIDFSFKIFKDYPFSRRYSNQGTSRSFNRCIFELFSFYFSCEEIRKVVEEKKDLFVKKFIELNDDSAFNEAIVGYPKMTEKVVTRFNAFANLLEELDDEKKIGDLQKYVVKNAGIEVIK
ncbi:DUF262 domain-containing protein [Lachnospira multipara]|uniref:GmrSD restriction endonucleases N-terminal domain-containing protein n=1 Tax=Lachnospira multipara TaxID=28051 RepID=A0A1H5S340_9FIRM|nr:DUF262 domain-containing protein [Lachnospira multipara]SEF45015.1 Protein of unknown function DUF262 [Lachnospira multipara]